MVIVLILRVVRRRRPGWLLERLIEVRSENKASHYLVILLVCLDQLLMVISIQSIVGDRLLIVMIIQFKVREAVVIQMSIIEGILMML